LKAVKWLQKEIVELIEWEVWIKEQENILWEDKMVLNKIKKIVSVVIICTVWMNQIILKVHKKERKLLKDLEKVLKKYDLTAF